MLAGGVRLYLGSCRARLPATWMSQHDSTTTGVYAASTTTSATAPISFTDIPPPPPIPPSIAISARAVGSHRPDWQIFATKNAIFNFTRRAVGWSQNSCLLKTEPSSLHSLHFSDPRTPSRPPAIEMCRRNTSANPAASERAHPDTPATRTALDLHLFLPQVFTVADAKSSEAAWSNGNGSSRSLESSACAALAERNIVLGQRKVR